MNLPGRVAGRGGSVCLEAQRKLYREVIFES